MKRKVLEIRKIPGVDSTDVMNLKIYVSSMDFRLSVGGYFTLGRSTLTSVCFNLTHLN